MESWSQRGSANRDRSLRSQCINPLALIKVLRRGHTRQHCMQLARNGIVAPCGRLWSWCTQICLQRFRSRFPFYFCNVPAMISSCVNPLKQALRQITQFTRLSANHVLLTRREPANHQNNCEKKAANPLTSRLTWKFEEELTLIDFHKGK